jgi:hypothetical protein
MGALPEGYPAARVGCSGFISMKRGYIINVVARDRVIGEANWEEEPEEYLRAQDQLAHEDLPGEPHGGRAWNQQHSQYVRFPSPRKKIKKVRSESTIPSR